MGVLDIALDMWRDERHGGEALARRAQVRSARLVAFARTRSAFYRRWYADVPEGRHDLAALPPVQKPQLMAAFDDWVTDPRVRRDDVEAFAADPDNIGRPYLGDYLVFTTSGTTGEPALLLQDRPTLDVLTALSMVRTAPQMVTWRTLGRVLRAGGRSASVWADGRPFGGASLVARQIRLRPSRGERLRIFSALAPVDELVAGLNDFQPGMLSGYATVLTVLAREQLEGRLDIRPGLVNNGGETLTAPMRTLVENAFAAPVFDGYGCSEMLMIAYDCGRGSMHLHADWVVLEPVDFEFRPTPPGERSSTVLLTNLANHVQPIIRYDLGDSVRLRPDPCACGSGLPAIEVGGRTNDVLSFRAPSGTAEIPPLPLVTVAEAVPGTRSVQLVQPDPESLLVRFDVLPGGQREAVGDEITRRLGEHLVRHGLGSVTVETSPDKPQRDLPSGKLRQVVVLSSPGA